MSGARVSAAMILAAGLGTRLRPLTDEVAKPMVPVGDRPVVEHIAARLRPITPAIVVNAHHRPEDLAAWAQREGVSVSSETELLGTAGGVAKAAPLLGDGDVLVWNGDILSTLDPRALVDAHAAAKPPALATLAVVAKPAGQGNVGIGEGGAVVRLRKESFGEEAQGGDFLGIHVLGASLRASLPERGCLVGDVYLPALRRGSRLAAHVVTASFLDVGTLERYLAANREWLAWQGLASWADPTATVEAPIAGSVVGARAEVHASCIRSVVWPDAVVREPVADVVVTPRAIVRAT
jgi:mannose-1-phosphate guanylyltransferase